MSSSSSVSADTFAAEAALFNICSLLGVLSLTLIVATAYFSTTVHRSELWFRHMIAWIVYSAAYLALAGHQGGSDPPFGLCFYQAALIYAVPIFPTLSAFCFVADLYIRLSAVVHNKRKIRPALKTFLGLFPLIVLACVFTEAMVLVIDPSTVGLEQNGLYCHVTTTRQSLISGGIILMTGLLIFPLEIWIAVVLYRNWRSFRGSRSPEQHLFLTMFIRIVLFTIISMLGVGLSSMSIGSPSAPKPYWTRLVLTIVPIIAAITFGSQEDIMRSWIFWREPPPDLSKPEMDADVGV
ncbi:hypothetical protein MSAN_00843500 [Mycena sanguinolenta]|uniref:Uncharacterized protein n=1 Tax=Mycena sanguinolenta TaxID=230812 RepID=A0A8H6YWM7_9AGAR|nr:hypothetical protein MSAN_00843500 [Mycena sanguinolenta]